MQAPPTADRTVAANGFGERAGKRYGLSALALFFRFDTWGNAQRVSPGWYEAAPLALGRRKHTDSHHFYPTPSRAARRQMHVGRLMRGPPNPAAPKGAWRVSEDVELINMALITELSNEINKAPSLAETPETIFCSPVVARSAQPERLSFSIRYLGQRSARFPG